MKSKVELVDDYIWHGMSSQRDELEQPEAPPGGLATKVYGPSSHKKGQRSSRRR